MCKNNRLARIRCMHVWLAGWLGLVAASSACRTAAKPPLEVGPALPVERIAIVGASVSAGFVGTPFGDAFRAATRPCAPGPGSASGAGVKAGTEPGSAPGAGVKAGTEPGSAATARAKADNEPGSTHSRCTAAVESWANLMLFRDPIGETKLQLENAIALHATTVVAVDLLFWHVYNVRDIGPALAELDKLYASGAWILVGDVPLITTASEMLLPKSAIPPQEVLDAANARIAQWAKRDRVILVPLAEWTAPLRAGGEIEIAPGEKVPAASLMAIDGLHANPLGTWYLLDKLDHFIEQKLPGTPKDALAFKRPR